MRKYIKKNITLKYPPLYLAGFPSASTEIGTDSFLQLTSAWG